jgi:hypothetical protein
MDCFVNMANGEIQFRSAEVEQAMQLTMEDRVFIDCSFGAAPRNCSVLIIFL